LKLNPVMMVGTVKIRQKRNGKTVSKLFVEFFALQNALNTASVAVA